MLGVCEELVRSDRDFITMALRISVRAAVGLSEELRGDRVYALELLQHFPSSFPYLSAELRRSRDFMLRAVRCRGEVLRYAVGWHRDPEVALTAIGQDSHAVHYVDLGLRHRREFAQAAVMVKPWAFEQLGSHHRGDLNLALAAARVQPALAIFASETIRSEVIYTVKKEQSEAVGAPKGYVEGPVWWTPEVGAKRMDDGHHAWLSLVSRA